MPLDSGRQEPGQFGDGDFGVGAARGRRWPAPSPTREQSRRRGRRRRSAPPAPLPRHGPARPGRAPPRCRSGSRSPTLEHRHVPARARDRPPRGDRSAAAALRFRDARRIGAAAAGRRIPGRRPRRVAQTRHRRPDQERRPARGRRPRAGLVQPHLRPGGHPAALHRRRRPTAGRATGAGPVRARGDTGRGSRDRLGRPPASRRPGRQAHQRRRPGRPGQRRDVGLAGRR